jgi:hypothetical protein
MGVFETSEQGKCDARTARVTDPRLQRLMKVDFLTAAQ